MKVTVIEWLGAVLGAPSRGTKTEHTYLLQAENGMIEEDTADIVLPIGYTIDLPDEEWHPDSEFFTLQCDRCGYVYEKKTVRGYTVACPVCNYEEIIPDE